MEHGISHNARFDLAHGLNRDNSNYPYCLLREQLLSRDIELNTPDVNTGRNIEFELHMNVMRKKSTVPAFVLLMETAQIFPLNGSQKSLRQYKRIFTWRDDLIDQKRYIKVNFPNKFDGVPKLGWNERTHFCCLIAGNKAALKHGPLDLYTERVRTIRWFEQNAPLEFDLFGSGWEVPPSKPGIVGRVWHRIELLGARWIDRKAFPSYKGKVVSKFDTLQQYKFAICYENVRDTPGYITEKIFDCLFAGCVPVYWGATNVTDYIPRECFIDRREYASHEELYRYMANMPEDDYQKYQKEIQIFLEGPAIQPFLAEQFAGQITSNILLALELS